jgi:hypothetical protein
MADVPDQIVLARDRDLAGRERERWLRRGLFAVAPVITILALLNVFGQRPQDSDAVAPAAQLRVHAPVRVRSGLLYGAQFTIEARRTLRHAVLVLAPGWFDGLTVNTIEPAPKSERSVDGETALDLGAIAAGHSHEMFMAFQVNSTTVGRRSQSVRLMDGNRLVVTVRRTLTVFP